MDIMAFDASTSLPLIEEDGLGPLHHRPNQKSDGIALATPIAEDDLTIGQLRPIGEDIAPDDRRRRKDLDRESAIAVKGGATHGAGLSCRR